MKEFSDKRSVEEVYLDTHKIITVSHLEVKKKFERNSLTITVGAIILAITFLINLTNVKFINLNLFLIGLFFLVSNLILVLISLFLGYEDYWHMERELRRWKKEVKCNVDFTDFYKQSLVSKVSLILETTAFFLSILGLILLATFGYFNIKNINENFIEATNDITITNIVE